MQKKIVVGLLMSLMSVSLLSGCGNQMPEKAVVEDVAALDSEDIEVSDDEKDIEEAAENEDEEILEEHGIEDVADQDTVEISATCYYDRISYEEEGFFYFIVLRDNGDAYLSMQDGDFGTWEDGVIHLKNWVTDYTFKMTDEGMYLDDLEYTYEEAPLDIIPDYVLDYMETGEMHAPWDSEEFGDNVDRELNPVELSNIVKDGDVYWITDYGSGDSYYLDDDTVIELEVPCYDGNCSSVEWVERYVKNSAYNEEDESDSDSEFYLSGFAPGDIWRVIVSGDHIEDVMAIYYWD